MNCKQGDLAVVVKSKAGNTGKVVTCVRLATTKEIRGGGYEWKGESMWVVDRLLNSTHRDPDYLIFDSYLRPIRDQDGEDEILRIAGYPNKDTANV